MAAASWVAATVYAAAKLGLADHLAGGPKSAVEVAGTAGVHAPSLHRLMRTLAGLGILTERDRQQFALTPLGEALKTGAPGSARSTLMAFCGPAFWHSWEEFVYSLETGKPGFERANGMPLLEYLAQHPEEASYFSEATTCSPTSSTTGTRRSVSPSSGIAGERSRGAHRIGRQRGRSGPCVAHGSSRC
jgi:hypothetical protein